MKKILFSINVTDNKKNEIEDGKELITKEVDNSTSEQIDKVNDEIMEIEDKGTMKLPLIILLFLVRVASIIIGGSILVSLIDVPLSEIYSNAAILFYIFPVCILIWISITLYKKRKKSEIEEDPSTEHLGNKINSMVISSFGLLDIPSDAMEIDFISVMYKMKNDKVRIVEKGMIKYLAIMKRVYVDNNQLHLSDISKVQSIPLDEIVSINKVNKMLITPNWNKDILPTKGIYKQYKLGVNQFGMVTSKPYYIATINHEQTEYLLYIPKYEIDNFVGLTNIQVTEN